ncbi:guanylate kinase [Candidatus Kaiserbacteria bacterium CG10_big_fil_rev_8_21_14_0_10_45_20]|uniref:Guanylate kinase n=1 Tax=Candidatus Kaiserbacteria bacterium CG10_big_fil_rev_8_21_14_0_10_45_20 TaxID=1974607 RepID=A0A2H0UFI4_9BACT|nr:MAG: guanylate kinase [Candidatus Kaiserbacteria bacterium CG10_big_fil_rev_8_21_14_0_10_45_20]
MRGRFVIVVGPSGAGKGTLVRYVLEAVPAISYAQSFVTRGMRPGEVNGEMYHFVSQEEFDKKIQQGDFLEWAEFGGNYYGTALSSVMPELEKGNIILKEVEVQGARQILEKIPRKSLFIIFIHAGSWGALEKRIRGRAPISEEEVAKRKGRYDDEMSFIQKADVIIENNDGSIEVAKKKIQEAVESLL